MVRLPSWVAYMCRLVSNADMEATTPTCCAESCSIFLPVFGPHGIP